MFQASHTGGRAPHIDRWLYFSRVVVLAAVHLTAFTAAYVLAFLFRFDFSIPATHQPILESSLWWVAGTQLTVFCVTGNFFGWWRYVTFSDLMALLRATGLSVLVVMGIDYLAINHYQIPRGILVMDGVFTLLIIGGLRSLARFSREHVGPLMNRRPFSKALFVGANENFVPFVQRIHHDTTLSYRVIGFLDTDSRKRGTRLGGLPILGHVDDVVSVAKAQGAKHILAMAEHLPGQCMRDLVSRCREAELDLKVIPAMHNLLSNEQRLFVRDVNIEDLLGREPVQLDQGAIQTLIADRVVLVTGAGGSIGSEICRQLLKFGPSDLVLLEQAENGLFHLERELSCLRGRTRLHACIADVLDKRRMEQVFKQFQPKVVFHAAAHKHVPLMETNPGEAFKNNVLGTRAMADLSHAHQVERFVLISTDKAVKPSSVMGATKQLAERYVHALSQESLTHFVVVRFGNVLGSAGSVVPLFREQIRQGGPITITDERMTRYFMTIPEASQLVLQASAMGKGGEIFVLDMGKPMKIVDLARDLIRLSGLSPDDIEIQVVGMRPGEKLHEELYFDDEQMMNTAHPKVFAAYHRPLEMEPIEREMTALQNLADGPPAKFRSALRDVVFQSRMDELPASELESSVDGSADASEISSTDSESSKPSAVPSPRSVKAPV